MRAAISRQNNRDTNQTRTDVASQNNQTRQGIAAAAEIGRNGRAANAEAGRNNRAQESIAANAARRAAAAGPAQPTPGQAGVQNRFDARRLDAIQKEERGYNADRTRIGAVLANGKDENGAAINEGRKTLLRAQYRTATDNLQNAQLRKAKLMKAQQPTSAALSKIPEGGEGTMPDGHVWRKQDGVVYIVK